MHNSRFIIAFLFVLVSVGVSYAAPRVAPEPLPSVKSYLLVSVPRAVVHDSRGNAVHDEASGTCVRTKWQEDSDPCEALVAQPPAPAPVVKKTHITISREDRTVYFGFNQASLSPEMVQRLNTLALTLRSDSQVRGARIIGYADRIGNPGYNEKLSQKRAENVRQYLVDKGIINTRVADTRWVGSRTSSTSCAEDMKRTQLIDCLQGDRRVEVEIDYATEVSASQ